jgi:hypothetical protein
MPDPTTRGNPTIQRELVGDDGARIVALSFADTGSRDRYLDREFSRRVAMEEPGNYTLPDGRELFVFCLEVRVYPSA